MTRTTDVFVGLNRRAEIARNAKARVFVSLHLNAFNGKANGIETFLHSNSTASQSLANNVNSKMVSELGKLGGRTITNRGVKKANFAVLRGTYKHMLSILAEVLFIDNKQDNNIVRHKDFAKTAAKAIADGIRQTVKGEKDVVVVIDPGHGGHDSGATGFGLKEKDVVLEIGLALRRELQGGASTSKKSSNTKKKTSTKSVKKSITQMADEVIAGKHGSGHDNRRKSLGISKAEYEKVRAEVNRRLSSTTTPKAKPKKTIAQMAQEVLDGKHGNGHDTRRKSLGISKAEYNKVRDEVNRRLNGTSKKASASKSISQMATEVLQGKHGSGHDRRRKSLGVSKDVYEKVRKEVNRRLK